MYISHFTEEKERLGIMDEIIVTTVQESWLGVPLLIGERVIGVISVQNDKPHAFDESMQFILKMIASQAAFMLESARLIEKARKGLGEQKTLLESLDRLRPASDIEELGKEILQEMATLIEYKRATLQILKGRERYSVATVGYELDRFSPFFQRSLDRDQLIRDIVERRKIRIIADTSDDDDWHRNVGTLDVESWMCIPLVYNDEAIGLIFLDSDRKNAFRSAETEL